MKENELDPLQVCADLSGPIDFEFSVKFVLKDTAGDSKHLIKLIINNLLSLYTEPTVASDIVTGGPDTLQICAELRFSESVEPGELKEFEVHLERIPGLYHKILLDEDPAIVYVCDEEGKMQALQEKLCVCGYSYFVDSILYTQGPGTHFAGCVYIHWRVLLSLILVQFRSKKNFRRWVCIS